MSQLARYQVYLEPQLVAAADAVAKKKRSSRAHVLREALSKYLDEKKRVSSSKKKARNPLLDLCGIGVSKTGQISQNVDVIYLDD